MSWAERAADRSATVQRSRERSRQQAEQILDAAHRLIAVKGDQFTTQELAKDAGVALQTFYRCFQSKDELLLAVVEDIVSDAADKYRAEASLLPDPMSRLQYYVRTPLTSLEQNRSDPEATNFFQFVVIQHWRLYQVFPHAAAGINRPLLALMADELQAAQDAGLVDVPDVGRAAAAIERLVTATYQHHAFTPDEDAQEAADEVWAFCLSGLGLPRP